MMEKPTAPGEGLKVIHAGLFRTASRSMAQAYRVLGYKTHHGLDNLDNPFGDPWELIEAAAEATWPTVPDAKPRKPFTRQDWDALWGKDWDIVTDLASPFCMELIKAYPEAKVVVVQRDYESWWTSFKAQCLDLLFRPYMGIQLWIAANVIGLRSPFAMTKVYFGFFDARSPEEIEAHAREKYEEFYRQVREVVPAERRLEYKLGSGWEPLCGFLGKDVPDVPFPRANDRVAHTQSVNVRRKQTTLRVLKKVSPMWIAILALLTAWRFFR